MRALLLCGLLLLSPVDTGPTATLPPLETEDYLDALDLTAWDEFFSDQGETEKWQRPSILIRRIAEGEEDPSRLILWLRERATAGLPDAAAVCLLSLITGVLAALFETLLDRSSVPARRVLSVGLGAMLLVRLLPQIRRGIACLGRVRSLAEVTVPLMTGALLLLGSPRGAAVMGTAGELLMGTCLRWMQTFLAPLALSAGVLRSTDLTGDSVLTAISRLLFTIARWGVRAICLGYSLGASLMGAGAAGMDSLLLRTGKVAVGSLPLVGSVVSDSLSSMTACLGLVKGALGRTGMLLAAWQCAGPAAELLLHGFGLRAVSDLLRPLDQREMGTMLSAMGEMLTILGALILAAGAMLAVTVGGAAGCFGGGL